MIISQYNLPVSSVDLVSQKWCHCVEELFWHFAFTDFSSFFQTFVNFWYSQLPVSAVSVIQAYIAEISFMRHNLFKMRNFVLLGEKIITKFQ